MKIIIVGAGEVGYHFAEWLAQEKKEVVTIDIDAEPLMRVSDHLDVQILQGSGSNPRVLEESGLKTADLILWVPWTITPVCRSLPSGSSPWTCSWAGWKSTQ